MRIARFLPGLLVSIMVLGLIGGCGTPESRKQKYLDKGRAYVQQENWEKARIEFRNALQIVPTDAEARFESGFVAEKLGRQRDAIQFYQNALDVRPDYIDATVRLARIYLLGGAAQQAEDTLKPALQKHPDDPKLLTISAGVKSQKQDLPGAIADAERAYKATPDAEDTIAVLAGLYKASNRMDDSMRTLEAGRARLPKSVDLRLALVQAYLAADRRDDAEKLLKELVALEPTHPEHALRLARFYAQTDRVPLAEQTLRDSIKSNPTQLPLKLAIVQLMAERKGKDAAEAELKAQIEANPKMPELKFGLAQFYADTQQPAKAETVLRGVISAEGTKQPGIEARDALALIKLRSGDVASAEKLVGEVLLANPRDTPALSLRADIAMGKNDPKSAIADLRSVLRDQPNSTTALTSLARAHIANGEPAQAEEVLRRGADANPNDIALKLALVDFLGRSGKADQARPIVDELAKRAPNNPNVIEAQFRNALLQRDVPAARAIAASAKAALPNAAIGDYLEGLANEADGKPGPALDSYGRALDRLPGAEDALDAFAKLAVREKKNDVLRARLVKITTEQPKIAHAWQLLGELDLGEHKLDEASMAFNKAIEAAPARLTGYRGLAFTKVTANDFDGAVAVLKSAEAKIAQPEDAEFEIAVLYQQRQRLDDAVKSYEAVLAKRPGYPVAANNLAMLLADRKDKPSLDRAKTLAAPFANSPNPRFIDTYGWVLTARGEYPEAIATLSKLVEAQPNVPAFRYHLALAQIKGGQAAAGRTNLEQALKGGDQFEGGKDARTLLDSLGKS